MGVNLRPCLLLLSLSVLGLAQGGALGSPLITWRLEPTGVQADPGADDAPLAVGSIQKPFVAKAWAEAHPGEAPPRFHCDPDSRCWLHKGHGELGLSQALTVSCNAYFRQLAEATPLPVLRRIFSTEGFLYKTLTAESAIGLSGPDGILGIRPSTLLAAYVHLVRVPWPAGEPVRPVVLAGLRGAALTGTANLGQRGYWAKTGTVPLPGDPFHTSGLAVAVDDTGWAILARLPVGTGTEAAAALGLGLARLRPGHMASPRLSRGKGKVSGPFEKHPGAFVRLRMLDLLGARRFIVRNAGASPISTSEGYLGPGGTLELLPGARVGPGLLEIQTPASGLQRRLEGELLCGRGPGKALTLLATLSLREYTDGVVAAELPFSSAPRRIELGAAVLRFLARNHRHTDADVCDSTHCAWYVGRGPRLLWTMDRRPRLGGRGATPDQAQVLATEPAPPLTNAEWAAILSTSEQPGPSQWSSHCGGTPLSPHEVWGFGNRDAPPCARHGFTDTRPWVREWPAAALRAAFGGTVERAEVGQEDGVWVLKVTGERPERVLRYDEAHRTLAKALGWWALPSPADRIEPVPGGFRATGVGLGHRVGLCLGD